jgi:hypothetical protein
MRLRARHASRLAAFGLAASLTFLGGCVSREGSSASAPASLPGVFGSRWTAPDFATRIVDAERAAVVEACVTTANSLGYSVNRLDGALGKISAARRQTTRFDGARQDTLDITVTTLGPGSTKVALTLREAVESGSDDERAVAMVTTSLVRARAPYDVFFDTLARALPATPAATPRP